MVKVSVIVPIYNCEKYINKCIDSIRNQTLEDMEIILVNDGSTDNCGKIIDEYAQKDKRIVVIHKQNGGQASARNMGLDIAKGKYIGFVDSDDWIDLNMFETLYSSVEQTSSDMGVCSRKIYSDKGNLKYEMKIIDEIIELRDFGVNTYIIERLLKNHTLVVFNKIYKSKVIKNNNIKFDSIKDVGSEDTLFNYKVLQHIEKIVGLDDVYYNCLAREGSTARSYDEEYLIRIGNLLQNIEEYSFEVNSKENSKEITPILMIHFLNRYIARIKNYSNENLVDCLSSHVKRAIEVNSIKLNINRIIFDQSYIKYIKKFGYTLKGIIFIKIFSLLCTLKMYKPAAKFITMKAN